MTCGLASIAFALAMLLPVGVASATEAHNGYYLNTGFMNGYYLNGESLNGYYLNGAALSGASVEGASLRGLYKGGQAVIGAKLEGSELVGYTIEPGACPTPSLEPCTPLLGSHLLQHRGAWFVGATIDATATAVAQTQQLACSTRGRGLSPTTTLLTPGNTRPRRVPLKIAAFVPSSQGASYQVAIDDAANPGQTLCGLDGGGQPVSALPLMGRWNPFSGPDGGAQVSASANEITFACLNAALGECVYHLGYRPWGRWVSTCTDDGDCFIAYKTMAKEHQACTRMMRADYCGDGTPHTVTGTKINLYDRWSVNDYTFAATGNYEWEALWDEVGAVNLNCARYQQLFGNEQIGECPALSRFPQMCFFGPDLGGFELQPQGAWIPPFAQMTPWYPTGLVANAHVPTCQSRSRVVTPWLQVSR